MIEILSESRSPAGLTDDVEGCEDAEAAQKLQQKLNRTDSDSGNDSADDMECLKAHVIDQKKHKNSLIMVHKSLWSCITKVEKDVKLNSVMSNSFGFGGTNATLIFEKV